VRNKLIIVLLVSAVLPIGAGLAFGQATTLTSAGGTETSRINDPNENDLAYDTINGLYLQVFALNKAGGGYKVAGQFMNRSGALVGSQFEISSSYSLYAFLPRVAYSTGGSAGVFLVAYSDDRNQIDRARNLYGQIVRYNGSGGEKVGESFPIATTSTNPAQRQEVGNITFNPETGKFLVPWVDSRGDYDVYVRLFNTDGTAASNEVNVSNRAWFQGDPSAAYDFQTKKFCVVFGSDASASGPTSVNAVLLDGTTAQPSSGWIVLASGSSSETQDKYNVMYLPEKGRFLAFWRRGLRGGSDDIIGRFVAPDGATADPAYPIIATPFFDGTPDGDYSWTIRNVIVSGQHDPIYAVTVEMNAQGTPISSIFSGSTLVALKGTFYPRVVAAWDQAQFGIGYTQDFARAGIDRWNGTAASTPGPHYGGSTPPPDPPPGDIDMSSGGAPNGSWFFAEGATGIGGFDTYYAIVNSNTQAVTVRGYFARENDGVVVTKNFTIPARSRYTVRLGGNSANANEVGLANGSYGAVFQSLTADQQIYVSRAMYWNNFDSGHSATAVPALQTSWYFAEGSRNHEFFDDFYLMFNPNATAATATIEYMGLSGGVIATRTITIARQARATVWADHSPQLANTDFSVRITSTLPIAAERAMYWGPNWKGGHCSLGAAAPAASWYFAEGAVSPGFDTYYLLLNPTSSPITIDATFLRDGGAPVTLPYTLVARSRETIHLNMISNILGSGGNGVAAEFHVRGGGASAVVERSIYWGTNWVEGTNAVGETAPNTAWYLPDATTKGSFETYLLIGNVGDTTATVSVYVADDAGNAITVATRAVAAKNRLTLRMNDYPALANRAFSIGVQSDQPIIAESAVYWNFVNMTDYWRGGATSFGMPPR
jgi:hypothetical protein